MPCFGKARTILHNYAMRLKPKIKRALMMIGHMILFAFPLAHTHLQSKVKKKGPARARICTCEGIDRKLVLN